MQARSCALLLAAALITLPALLSGQVGSGQTDIIMGKVVGPDGKPIAGARVEAMSIELETRRSKNTNADGRYTILFPDGGGQYTVTVRVLGMAPATQNVGRIADEDRLEANFVVSPLATVLQAITIRPNAAVGRGAPSPGDLGATLTADQLMRLPIDLTDPVALALLMPGVIGIDATDTTASAFSVAGQRTDQNSVTLDGLSFGGNAAMPPEAVRSTRVITNTYDVSRGGFTGGQIASTTRQGTNVLTGLYSYQLNDPHFEFAGNPGLPSSQSTLLTQNQLSGYLGGAFAKDKAFWMVSGLVRQQARPLAALSDVDANYLNRLGIDPDSVAQFLGAVNGYGEPLTVSGVPAATQITNNATFISRFDYHLNDDHTLMIRPNWTGTLGDAYRSSNTSVLAHSGTNRTGNAGVLASLTSQFGDGFLNEIRATYSKNNNNADPYLASTEGRVRVTSDVDSAQAISTLSFGGNSGLPNQGTSSDLQSSDEISWLSRDGSHRYKLGGLVDLATSRTLSSNDLFGSYTYNSLSDFIDNTPASYIRTLQPLHRASDALNGSLYLGDTYRQSRAFQLTYGGRIEGTTYGDVPAYNPVVDSAFGFKTNRFPHEIHVSPRAGFTWIVNGNNQPQRGQQNGQQGQQQGQQPPAGGGRGAGGGGGRGGGGGFGSNTQPGYLVISGGVGEFRANAPASIFQSAVNATGLPGSQQTLNCVGPAVPIPDWSEFYNDPTMIPTTCADGTSGTVFSSSKPNVTVIDPHFEAPRAWRSNINLSRSWTSIGSLINRWSGNFTYNYAYSLSQYGARDLNLNATPQFTLSNEDNRPVFVPAAAIIPSTGASNIAASRINPNFSQVFEAISQLHGRTNQLIGGGGINTSFNLQFTGSYTYSDIRDQSGFSAGGLTGAGGRGTVGAGNPNALAWGVSDQERKHVVTTIVTWTVSPVFDFSSTIRFQSGGPYTPLVSGDLNGDGSRGDDRAFIFNPATVADTGVAHALKSLMTSGPQGIRSCLTAQVGEIASRNSCWTSWSQSLNFQANLRPWLGPELQHRMYFNVQLLNPLAGLDQLVHGVNHLQGWGQPARADPSLLYITGFNPLTNSYIYSVNARFGDNPITKTAFRTPVMFVLQAHWQVGPDRQREMLTQALTALNGGPGVGGGRGGRGGGGQINFRLLLDRIAPNPVQSIIDMKDTLKLTGPQIARLQVIADSLHNKNEAMVKDLEAQAEKGAAGQEDPQAVLSAYQPTLLKAQQNYRDALLQVKDVLTPAQWALLPDPIRNPPAANPAGRGGRGGGGGPPPPDRR